MPKNIIHLLKTKYFNLIKILANFIDKIIPHLNTFQKTIKKLLAFILNWSVCHRFDLFIYSGLFILFFFPPIFTIGSVHINAAHLIGVSSLFYLIWNEKLVSSFTAHKNIRFIFGFIVFSIYTGTLSILNRAPLSPFTSSLFFLIDVIPFAFVLIHYGRAKKYEITDYLSLSINVGVIQAITTFITLLFPPAKKIILDMLVDYGHGEIVTLMPHRMFGFSGLLTFAAPILQGFLAVMAFYFCFTRSPKYYFAILALITSAILNARVSVVVIGIGVILVLAHYKIWGLKHTLKTLKYPLYFLPVLLLGIFILYWFKPSTFSWIFTGIGEIFSLIGGNKNTPTFSSLLNPEWYKLPHGIAFFFGTGHQVTTNYNGFHSDIGFINDLWFGGLCYVLFTYSLFYYVMWQFFKSSDKAIRFFGLFSMIIMPIINFKGIAFSMTAYSNLIVILSLAVLNYCSKENSIHE